MKYELTETTSDADVWESARDVIADALEELGDADYDAVAQHVLDALRDNGFEVER